MSLYNDANIIITPNGREPGKLFSLKPTNGSGDATVVRATNATEIGSGGNIIIPITNLLVRSQEFETASWVRTNILSITPNVILAPDGSLTADFIVPNTSNTEHNVNPASAPLAPISNVETLSVYAKAGGYNFLALRCNVDSGWRVSHFNLQTGTVSVASPNFLFTKMENVGDGWYRCSITYTNRTANGLQMIPCPSAVITYAGDGVSGVYLWGAQLENNSEPYEYISTEAVQRTKFGEIILDDANINNLPRFEYLTGSSCPSILVEPQATNSLWPSTLRGPNWTASHADYSIADVTINGLLGRSLTILNTTNGIDYQRGLRRTSQTLTILTGQTFAVSFYCRKTGSNSTFGYYMTGTAEYSAIFNVDTNSRATGYSSGLTRVGFNIENLGNGVYKCTDIITATADRTWTSVFMGFATGVNTLLSGMTGEFSQLQFEQGVYSTTPIITQTAPVTRNSDLINKTGISSLIGQTEGTIVADFNISHLVGQCNILELGTDANNRIRLRKNANAIECFVTSGGSTQANIVFSSITTGRYKLAFTYGANDFRACLNGTLGTADTSGSVPAMSEYAVGSRIGIALGSDMLNDTINSIVITPYKINNSYLQEYTTL